MVLLIRTEFDINQSVIGENQLYFSKKLILSGNYSYDEIADIFLQRIKDCKKNSAMTFKKEEFYQTQIDLAKSVKKSSFDYAH